MIIRVTSSFAVAIRISALNDVLPCIEGRHIAASSQALLGSAFLTC